MALPTEVWVCGQRCAIQPTPGGRFGTHGYISLSEGYIRINDGLNERYQREVLLHEIIHGVDFAIGSGETDLAQFLEGEKNRPPDEQGIKLRESEVIFLSRGLWWTLTDPRNAAVTRWIFEGN